MSDVALAIEADKELIEELRRAGNAEGITMSDPVSVSADALNAPIGADQIKLAFELITILFTTGSAGIEFIDKVLNLVRKLKRKVVVKDPATGKKLGEVGPDTTVEQAHNLLGK